jgi:CRP/FNR family transcriptional regulator, anaerobic regulatory protein
MKSPDASLSATQPEASCSNCVLPELCLRAGMSPEEVAHLDQLVYVRRRVKRGEDLYRAGDPFCAIYAIRSGFFKNEVGLKDGRDQIMGFHMPGELIGMDGIGGGYYTCNAVALDDADVCGIPLSRIEDPAMDTGDLSHRLHQIMSQEMVRDQHVMVLLGSESAETRLAAFLVDISRRFAARGFSAADFDLPMTREEIGSFLGLKLETVSRMFSKLHHDGLLAVQQRHIRIVDPAGLERLLDMAL